MEFDKDLRSIQEARDLIRKAKAAQKALAAYDQAAIDSLVKALADAGIRNAEKLARMAQEETGFGRWQDKVLKNLLGSRIVYDHIKDMKTIGVLREDNEHGITEIAVPVGVVVALIPSTNPTSTTLYKTLISIKSGNSIVISPHPSAKNCILETVRILQEAAREAGATGGTVLRGRGTANQEAERFFHITIQPEKELVMILVRREDKDAILHAIYHAAGLNTAGQGIAFSLPVDSTAGLPDSPHRAIPPET